MSRRVPTLPRRLRRQLATCSASPRARPTDSACTITSPLTRNPPPADAFFRQSLCASVAAGLSGLSVGNEGARPGRKAHLSTTCSASSVVNPASNVCEAASGFSAERTTGVGTDTFMATVERPSGADRSDMRKPGSSPVRLARTESHDVSGTHSA